MFGRVSNEVLFLYQVFGWVLGINNFLDCFNMCYEVSGIVFKCVIGVGKGMVMFKDFDVVDIIFVFGQNLGINYLCMLNVLCSVVKCGVMIVLFNNLKEVGLQCFVSL